DWQGPVNIDLLGVQMGTVGQDFHAVRHRSAQSVSIGRVDLAGWAHRLDTSQVHAVQLYRAYALARQRRQLAQVLGATLGDGIREGGHWCPWITQSHALDLDIGRAV